MEIAFAENLLKELTPYFQQLQSILLLKWRKKTEQNGLKIFFLFCKPPEKKYGKSLLWRAAERVKMRFQ